MTDFPDTIKGTRRCDDGTCEPVTLTASTATQRSGWTVLLWGLVAFVCEAALRLPDIVTLPDPVRPLVPVLAGIVGYVLRLARSKSWVSTP